ncbi:hypothetical protein [Thiofilum flexile]|uniref:hypothetical protein n=1 Tax=Thiofilum flexile TaxID=125627 RepID=UPI00035DFD49|nr:hypothetical protein [Thiofilum flexile]
MKYLIICLLLVMNTIASASLPIRVSDEKLIQNTDHLIIGRVVGVDMIDKSGKAITNPNTRTGPGLTNTIRLIVKVDSVALTNAKKVPPVLKVPLDPFMHFTLGQIKTAHSGKQDPFLLLLKGDNFQPPFPGVFSKGVVEKDKYLKAIKAYKQKQATIAVGQAASTDLTWKDKGLIKQNVTIASCKDKKLSINSLPLVKQYRLFEINEKAFWAYIHNTKNRAAIIRLPFPDGTTAPVRLDPNSPTIAPNQGVPQDLTRLIHEAGSIPGKEIIYGSLSELAELNTKLLNRSIAFDVTGKAGTYRVELIRLDNKPNHYAVYSSNDAFACPRPPLRRH